MPATAWLRRRAVELGWFAFAVTNLLAMIRWERWETIPFHFIWVSLTLVYGFRVWRLGATALTLGFVIVSTGALITIDISRGTQVWGELFEVPLMSAMFMAMVWHARRRQDALGIAERHAEQLESTLEREEQFLHDASHELRTPVTIARGHLEVLGRSNGRSSTEVDVAVDELSRMERILDRLLLLARADQPDFLELEQIVLDHFLEDVFMRWSEIAPRSWRLGALAHGTLRADPEQLRIALDALLENAVKYSEPGDRIELSSRATGSMVVIEVDDEGIGVPDEPLARIFERFARSDPARTRTAGGVGLGLAIVDTIVKAHGGRSLVRRKPQGSVFGIQLPGFMSAWPSLQSAVARTAGATLK
ncbi:MAG: HAMP domain-containing histidine kinase [Actinobacteria bacterium]|nr:MAG: HAMP domain-containing histidine kinase [Actinomycetota bacterium]